MAGPWEQFQSADQGPWSNFAPITPKPSAERTTGEAFKDIGASVVGGFGSLLQVPGQLAQLVPGLQGVGQALAKPGELLEEKGEALKSQGLKVREALRSQAISEAEKEGILSSFATAITETVKDPALLSTFITGQLPQLLGPAAAAKVGKAVVMSRSGLEGAELAAQAGKIGTRSAIGAGAVMQGADISADTYKQAFEAAQKQGMSVEDANAAALTAARKAFALATPISVASQYLPGGSAIERRLAGVAGKGRIKGALGEAVSEGIEEGGGAFATNVGVLGVDPTRELTQGVGSAAGLGTLGGGVLGGVLGKATAPELPPELRPGETDRQAAERIQAEILAMKQAAQPPVAPPSPVLDTEKLYNLMAQPNGYALVEQYKQRLAQLPETKETKPAIDAAIEEAAFIQRRAVIEEIGRQPTKAVLNERTLKQMGFRPNDGVYESLLGKDMASPDQAEEMTQALSPIKDQEGIAPSLAGKVDNFLATLNEFQESIYPKGPPDVREAVAAPSGEGVPVAGKPSAGVAAEGVAAPVPGGVVPAVEDVGQPAAGEGQKPAPVAPPVAETAEEVFREAALDWAEQNIKGQAPVTPPVAPPAPAAAPPVAAAAVAPVQPVAPATVEAPAAELTPTEATQQIADLKSQQTNLLTKAGKVPAPRSPARQKYDALSAQIADLEGKQVTVKTRKPRKPPTTIMGSPMLAGIFNKIGGLHTSLMSEFSTRFITKGLDKNGKPIVRWRNPLVTGYGTLFNKKGKVDFGEIAEHLELEGYLEPGSLERDYKDAGERAKDLIKKALNREEVLPIQDRIDKDAQEREASERQRTLDIQEENRMIASGELQLEPEFDWSDAEIEQNLGLDREFQTDLEMYDMEPKDLEFLSDAELESDLTDAEQDQARRPPKADADAARQAAEGAAPGETEALLTRPTEEGLRAKQEAAEKATAEEKRTRDAEQERLRKEQATKEERARADESAKDFELGKSAEEQMTGMGDLFGKKSLADIPATRWGEIERKAKAARETAEKAEATPEQAELNKEIEAKIDELGKVLSRIMGRFGLKDVALKLVEDMKAEGEYAQSVVRLALDAASPVQALRHESIHALKELGFFSPQQWSALEKQAKSKWIDQYLKNVNVNKEPLGEGEKSRYDAYMDLYKGDMDAIIEEAIADAFGDFDVNKAPPGLMQALLNRLRQFFDGVKTVFGGEVTAEQVFRKAERGELKAEAAPATEGETKSSLRVIDMTERRARQLVEEENAEYRQMLDDRASAQRGRDLETLKDKIYPWLKEHMYAVDKARQIYEDLGVIPDLHTRKISGSIDLALDRFNYIAENAYAGVYGEVEFYGPPSQTNAFTGTRFALNALDNNGAEIVKTINDYLQAAEEYRAELSNRSPRQREQKKALAEILDNVVVGKFAKPSLRAPKTEAFKKWFGNSKVVDENGEPLVVYHGTNRDITAFDANKIGAATDGGLLGAGFYFTKNPDLADAYAKQATNLFGGNENILPVFVSIKNPFYSGGGSAQLELMRKLAGGKRPENMTSPEGVAWAKKLRDGLIELGHDGVIDTSEGSAASYANEIVAFYPEQIKSATGNIGTFDITTPDIRYSLRSTIPTAARQRIAQTTVTRDEKTFYQRIIEAISPSNFESFRADALNRYNQLSVYDKELAKKMGGKALLANSSAEAAALLSDLGAGLTASALGVHDRMGGVPVYKNGITTISNKGGTVKGPTAIFSPLATQPGDYQAYQYWAAVKRGLRLLHTIDPKTGKVVERLITAADGPIAEALRKQYLKEFKIDFESIQEEWIKYNNGLVEFMLDTGVLSQDRADAYRQYADYLPFYRQMNGEETVGPKIFQSIAGVKPPKKIKGGEARLDDFLENIVRNTQSAIQAGVKNIASQRAAQVAVGIQMADRLSYQSSAPNVFHVYENGRPISYKSEDALFINAIKSLGIPDLPFIGFLAGPANLLRNLVTKDPGFMLANLMRDSMSAWVTSGVKMKPMIDTISNFGSALAGKSPEFQALMNAGILGGYEFSQNVEASGREFGKALRKQANVKQPGMKGVLEFGAKPFTSLWEALEKGSTASDAATRIEIYKRTLAETGNEAEALYRALEVMNFNRKGSSAVVRILTAAVPFLNARMQGLDVLYRASTGNMNAMNAKQIQKNFFVRGATIAALSTAYWALTHDDDEYKKQEQETRDNYWLLPSMGVKIPIPFEIGVLFKVIPERLLQYGFGSDTGEDFLKSMARNLMSTLSFNPIPQTALPIIETAANFSFFTMRPIVGQGLEGLQPAYQVGPGTSRLAETIGGATRGLPTELQISPAKLDQLINGYTGTMGMYMVNLMDAIFDMNTDSPKPSRRFEQMPLIRRFALDPEARGSVTAYYELKNKVDSVVRTSNMLERTMNYEELPEFLQDNMTMLASKDYLLDLEKTIKEFREMKIMIRSAQMSADSKRDAISSIEKMENQLTANIQYLKKLAKGG